MKTNNQALSAKMNSKTLTLFLMALTLAAHSQGIDYKISKSIDSGSIYTQVYICPSDSTGNEFCEIPEFSKDQLRSQYTPEMWMALARYSRSIIKKKYKYREVVFKSCYGPIEYTFEQFKEILWPSIK